jgi:hypothetical protein
VETIFGDSPGKWLFLHQIKGIRKQEAREVTSALKLTTLSHGTWLWHTVKYVTTTSKDYGYVECEY